VHSVDQGWGGHEDDLQDPETDVGDGESPVVADILAARLLGVAGEEALLVPPHLLDAFRSHHQHHDPEDEQHREPDPADASGVPVHPDQNRIEALPVHLPSKSGRNANS
uniref:Uncharacterized protein n=1 Tax=Callorhinchus milii TaxID=7868 RepID=A0A4W3K8G1_CALMI